MTHSNIAPIKVNSRLGSGFLMPTSLETAIKAAEIISKSTFCPANFKGKEADIIVALQYAQELDVHPIQLLQNMFFINGRACIWGDLVRAICLRHYDVEKIKETFDESKMVATCTIERKNKEPVTRTFSKEKAVKAGLWSKSGPWTTYPDRMIALRAFGFASRDACADILKGIITREEAEDCIIEVNRAESNESNIKNVYNAELVKKEDYVTITSEQLKNIREKLHLAANGITAEQKEKSLCIHLEVASLEMMPGNKYEWVMAELEKQISKKQKAEILPINQLLAAKQQEAGNTVQQLA